VLFILAGIFRIPIESDDGGKIQPLVYCRHIQLTRSVAYSPVSICARCSLSE
jgi:hypothetical protein